MSITTPHRGAEVERGRDLERRVADLEALIEEARRRARRRRTRRGAAALLVVGAGVVAFVGFGGHGGGAGKAATARARGSQGSTANAESQPLGALPAGTRVVDSFAFDPRNPQIVYVMARGANANQVLKTTDGGSHWRVTATSGSGWVGANQSLAADPRHPGTLYAGTAVAVYKTTDGGRSWRPSKNGLFAPPGLAREGNDRGWVIALAVDPANTDIVYAGSNRVSRSTDGGHSWQTVLAPQSTSDRENVSALAIAPTQPETIYAIRGDFATGLSTIYKSTDAGTTWHATTSVRGFDADGFDTALAVDGRHPATVYAAVNARVMKTTNGGQTWQSIAPGLPVTATRGRCRCRTEEGVTTLAVDPRRSGAVYAAVTQGGIYKTTDAGRTWSRVLARDPATDAPLDSYTVAVDPARPTTIYAAGSTETADGPRIFRSTNGARAWAVAR